MADYVFIETVSEHASPVTRYEVRCSKCGECYGEDSRPLTYPPVSVAVEPPIVWPRDHEPVPPRDWRQEVRERVDRAGDVTTRVSKEAAGAAQRWGGHAAARVRTWTGVVTDAVASTKRTLESTMAARRRGEHEPDTPAENQATPQDRPDTAQERPGTPEGRAASEVVGDDQTGG